MSEEIQSILTRLDVISRTIKYSLEYNEKKHGKPVDDNTHVVQPTWHSHGQLNAWIKTMADAADAIAILQKRQLPDGFSVGKMRNGETIIITWREDYWIGYYYNVMALTYWGKGPYFCANKEPHRYDLIEIDGEKTEAGKDQ